MAWVWYLFCPEGSGKGLSPLLHRLISLILNQIVYSSPITDEFLFVLLKRILNLYVPHFILQVPY